MDQQTPKPPPSPKPKLTICPYCGSRSRSLAACDACGGKFDPLSRQATQNAMGPWFVRDGSSPYRPGCAYETLVRLIERGAITGDSVIRGPSSRQFWTLARWCPGVAHLLGICHSCQQPADPLDSVCGNCGAAFRAASNRQQLGLGEVRFLPGRGSPADESDLETTDYRISEPAGERHIEPAAATGPAPVVNPRSARLERELRRARRWRTVWCVAFCATVLLAAGVFVLRALDLDAGPIGRWMAARERRGDTPAAESRLSTNVTPITTPALSDTGAPVREAPFATAAGSVEVPGAADSSLVVPRGHATDAVTREAEKPGVSPGSKEPPLDSGSQARVAALETLRRLR